MAARGVRDANINVHMLCSHTVAPNNARLYAQPPTFNLRMRDREALIRRAIFPKRPQPGFFQPLCCLSFPFPLITIKHGQNTHSDTDSRRPATLEMSASEPLCKRTGRWVG